MNEKQNSPAMPVFTGQHWGQYRIIGLVEQGRFSRAYLGEYVKDTSKLLVVEIFPITLTADDSMAFQRSGHALMQLVHPSILRLFDVGIENTIPFMVLDFIVHTPLRQLYLQGQGQPLDKLLPYLRQVASALQYAHANGRAHKHLCPDNVLLGPNNTVLVCDFAIDCLDKNQFFQNYRRSTLPTEPLTYMAPEQIQQQPVNASDQYALGTMIYEWLCGTPPFVGKPAEIAQQQLYSAPPGLRQKVPGISPEVEAVVMMALVKEPGKRFANVPAFVKALEQAYETMKSRDQHGSYFPAGGLPTPLPPTLLPTTPPSQPIIPGPLQVSALPFDAKQLSAPNVLQLSGSSTSPSAMQQKPGNPTRRRGFLLLAAGVAILGGIGSWLLLNNLQYSPPPPPPTTPTPIPPQLVYSTHTLRVNAVAWSPDGQKIASASDDKLVLILDRAGKTLLTYSGHQDCVNAVAWSPNGKYIASGSADRTVQVWDATSGKLVFTYTKHTDAVNAVTWSPDSRLIASGSDDKIVYAWLALTGTLLLHYRGHTAPVTSVAWSPNMQRIASGSLDQTLQVCSTIPTDTLTVGGRIFSSTPHGKDVIYAVAWSPDGTRIASAGGDNLVQVSSGIDGTVVKSQSPLRHDKPVRSVDWSPDSTFIVSGSDDKTARIWNATTGESRAIFAKHSDSVLALDWSSDSVLVASGSIDTTVQLWKSV